MDLSPTKSNSIAILRQQAEEILNNSPSNSDLTLLSYQTLELLHEMEVHQVELMLQNEELIKSQILAQDAVDLYNYAPNGYFTLSPTTEIIDLNNTGATLLKKEKSKLIGNSFGFFVTDETKPILANFLQKVLRDKKKESCEITLSLSESDEIFVQLTGIVDKTGGHCLVTIIDVTERKQAELALKQSDERFQMLFNKAPLGYQSLDFDGCFLEVNQQWLDMLGYTHEEVIGKWFGDFMPPYYQELVKVNFPKFKAQGHIQAEFEMIHKNGTTLFIGFDGKIGYDVNGDFKQTHCILQDITESTRTKNALRESEEKFRNTFENTIVGISLTRIDGKLSVNKAFRDIVGYSEEELNQMKWREFTHKDDVELNERIVKSILDGEYDSKRWEKRYIHKNGNIVWADISAFLQRDEAGNPLFFITTINDITDSKRAEKELKENREQFRDLFENAPVGYHEINVEGKIVRMNKTELDMLCYSADEVLGHFFWEFAPDKNFSKKSISAKLTGLAISHDPFEREFCRKDGARIPVLIQDVILYDEVGNITGIRSTVQDITERKKWEEAILRSEDKFKKAFMTSPDCFTINRLEDGMYVEINPGFTKIVGYTEDDIIGKTSFEKNIWYDLSDRKRWVDELKENGNVANFVAKFTTKKGEMFYGLVSSTFIELDGIEHVLSIIRDITEIKKAQDELIEREVQYHNLANSGTALIWAAGLDKLCFYFNHPWLKFTGRKMEQELCNGWMESVHPDDFDQCLNTYVTSFDKRIAFEMEYRMRNAEGKYRWILDLGTPNYNSSGEFVGYIGHCFDITERKKAEYELRVKDNLLKGISENIDAIIWRYSIRTDKWLYVSPQSEKILGYNPNEWVNLKWWKDIMHPLDQEWAPVFCSKYTEMMEAHEFEYRLISKTGEIVWVLDKVGIEIENGKPAYMYGIMLDITERKKAEEKLIESEEKYRSLLENSGLGVGVYSTDGKVILFNQKALENMAGTAEDYIGKSLFEIFDEQSANVYYNRIQETIASEQAIEYEDFVPLSSGDYWFISNFTKIKNDSGEIIAVQIISQDISERKRAEKALTESEKKLATLFGNMTEMVIIHELVLNEIGQAIDYRIIDCNDTFTQITGIEKEKANGKLATKVYQTDQAPYLEEYTKVCITGQSLEYKTYYQPLDKHFIISAVSTGINQFATITTDITAIEKTHEVIKEKNKELENYMYVASHDLRSPLVNIQGFSQRLERQTNVLKKIVQENIMEETIKTDLDRITNEEIPKSLNFILSNVVKMDTLINGLLQLSRTGRILMTIAKIDMNKLFKSIMSAHNYELTEIEANVQIDDLADCYGDENQLNQLFSNIINNAIKYRDKNQKLKIQIASQNQYKRVIYSIKDSGIGINARHLEKIWDVFYRVDSFSLEAGEGIGLSLARRIVDKHEGKIWVESEEGKGSTFFIELHRNEFGE